MIRALASLALVTVVLAGIFPAAAQDRIPNLITVTGEGEVSVAPDLAILGGGVTTTGKTAREASEANAKMMNAVMGALTGAGIADRDVQTSRLSLHSIRDSKNNSITGFQATNQVSIRISDVTKVADVIDRLVSAGANDISGVQFVVSSPSKLLDEARIAAMADARRKAEIYAKAGSVILGPPVIISEDSASPPEPVVLMRAAKAATDTPISPGEQVQRVTVTVAYELQR